MATNHLLTFFLAIKNSQIYKKQQKQAFIRLTSTGWNLKLGKYVNELNLLFTHLWGTIQ